MITYTVEIERFEQNADKTGWHYIFLPDDLVQTLLPDDGRSFRVKGKIDDLQVNSLSLLPVKHGGYILPMNEGIRKKIKKKLGDKVHISFEKDAAFRIEMPEDLEICLAQEEDLLTRFLSYTKSHQNYFISWLNTAKTDATREKRLLMIVNAMALKQDYGLMIRSNKKEK
jgi:hypothetical protein